MFFRNKYGEWLLIVGVLVLFSVGVFLVIMPESIPVIRLDHFSPWKPGPAVQAPYGRSRHLLRYDGEEVRIGGVPITINEIKTRRGERMAFVTIEDLKGSIEIIVFAELYKEVAIVLKGDQPIMVKGKVTLDANNQKAKVRAEEIMLLSDAFKRLPTSVHFSLDASVITKPQLEKFKNILKGHPGECNAFLHLVIPHRSETVIALPAELRLRPTEALFQEVEYLLGNQVITLH